MKSNIEIVYLERDMEIWDQGRFSNMGITNHVCIPRKLRKKSEVDDMRMNNIWITS